jgi:hypothetical protein
MGTLNEDLYTFIIISLGILLRKRNVSEIFFTKSYVM